VAETVEAGRSTGAGAISQGRTAAPLALRAPRPRRPREAVGEAAAAAQRGAGAGEAEQPLQPPHLRTKL